MYEWFLETTEDADLSICIVLNEIKEYKIGRRKGYDIVSTNPLVSRNHGVLAVKSDRRAYIRDLESANGTYINNKKIKPFEDILLENNDLLGIGAPSNAIEPKKEMFWVRCQPLPKRTAERRILKEADSTNIEDFELFEPDEAENLEQAEVFKLNNKNISESSNYLKTGFIQSSDNGKISKEINLNESTNKKSDAKINEEKDSKEDLIKAKITESVNELPSSSTNKITNSNSTNKNVCDILPTSLVNETAISKFKNKNDCAIKNSEELPSTTSSKVNETVISNCSNKNDSSIKKSDELPSTSTFKVNESVIYKCSNKNDCSIKKSDELPSTSNSKVNETVIYKCSNKNDCSIKKSDELPSTSNSKVNETVIYKCSNKNDCSIKKSDELPSTSSSKIKETVTSKFSNKNDCFIKKSDEFPSTSTSKVQFETKSKNTCKVKERSSELFDGLSSSSIKTENSLLNYLCNVDNNSDEEKLTSNKVFETTRNSDVSSSKACPDSNDKGCETTIDAPENHNSLSQKTNDDQNGKLNIEYLNSLIEKRKNRKFNIEKITIDTSSDEEEINKTKNTEKIDKSSDLKLKNGYESDDDIFVNRLNIKTEPTNHSFTQNDDDDIVVISDDDDEFPKSQLFDDVKREPVENENSVTTEGSTSPSSDNNHDNIFSTIVKNEIHEYDDNDNEEDAFDDDCILWYQKLSQSQDLISTKKKETKFLDEEAEKEDFFKFDDDELDIFDKDVEKPQDEDSRESRSTTAVDDDEVSKSKDVEPELDDTTDSRIIETASSSKLSSPDKKEKSKEKKDSKKSYVKPPVIDAPFLVKGKRKAHEDDKNKENTAKPKRRKSIHDEVPSVPAPAVQSSKLNIDKSVREELDKRHKKTRKRRQSTETLTKNEKQRIQEDRKKKLKELASKTAESKEKKEIPKTHTKPKVKVSSGRGLFLTGVESKQEEKKKKSDAPLEDEPATKKRFKIPRRSDSISSEPSTSRISKLSFNNIVSKESDVDPLKSDTNGLSIIKINKLSFSSLGNIQETVETPRRLSITSNNNSAHKPRTNGILLDCDPDRKSGKRVRFKEQPEIKYIERIGFKKVEFKDAPVPVINTRCENEILTVILDWRPAWLDEQKRFTASPQVYRRKPLRMLTNFNTVGDYLDIITPLMLLEIWRCVFKDWCASNTPVKLACVDTIQPKPDGLHLNCYCLTDRVDSDTPKVGDFFIAEFYLDDGNSKMATLKRFGYVVQAFRRRMVPTDVIHKQFIEMGPKPQFIVYFTMVIKKLQVKILREKLMRIRLVSRISPNLRLFKAVSYIKNSPLCNYILKPTVQQYKITNLTQMTSAIEDKLNTDQMMCIYEAYQICTRNEPGIYLIQGPPGTGKSYVIKNLIRQLLNDSTKPNAPKCRILLCAPSNGAIDELANSLLEMRSKLPKRLKMIRLGPPNSIVHPKVKQISVPELVEKHLQNQRNNDMKSNPLMSDEYNFLIKKEITLKSKIMSLEERNEDCSIDKQSLRKVQDKLLQLKTSTNTFQERKKQERDAEITLIENAEIICSTLFSCTGSRFEDMVAEKKMEFTCCIIDEATQSSEPETLNPLLLGITKLVLVGDPEQLSPTTISQEAKNLGHGTSLFARIQSCLEHLPENPIRMLTYQYRMHPEICKFPSKTFYGSRLVTAEDIVNKTESILYPCRLFCLNTTKDYMENEYLNKAEANLVFLLTETVLKRTKFNVGIITPYNIQKDYLISRYKAMRGKEGEEDIHRVVINTVDGFQGQERDVIIISSVRYKSNIFLNDVQRLNVALTRAKHAVYICAHADLFKAKSVWQELEIDAKKRNFFYSLSEKDASDERYMSDLIPRLILRR